MQLTDIRKYIRNKVFVCACCSGIAVWIISSGWCFAGRAAETLVVANLRMMESENIARYYMKLRNIPEEHLLLVSLTDAELMEREEYDTSLKIPVREKIEQLQNTDISTIVLIYGVPLKVNPPLPSLPDQKSLRRIQNDRSELKKGKGEGSGLKSRLREFRKMIEDLAGTDQRAAVDSELALVKVEDYRLKGWIENPYFLGYRNRKTELTKNQVLMVCRLDGPDPQTVYRIINDTLAAEKKGLIGVGYFDARWPLAKLEKPGGYKYYDRSLHKAAELVKRRMPVQLDATEELFAPGSAGDAALYSGWYSLGQYVDSFSWVQGAVGYHIASHECRTLRKENSTVWCLQMLKKGVAATIGPVYEPYVQGFPVPEIFFGVFSEGHLNLGESYLVSLPYISWQMVLIGDPLYSPFPPLVILKNTNHQ